MAGPVGVIGPAMRPGTRAPSRPTRKAWRQYRACANACGCRRRHVRSLHGSRIAFVQAQQRVFYDTRWVTDGVHRMSLAPLPDVRAPMFQGRIVCERLSCPRKTREVLMRTMKISHFPSQAFVIASVATMGGALDRRPVVSSSAQKTDHVPPGPQHGNHERGAGGGTRDVQAESKLSSKARTLRITSLVPPLGQSQGPTRCRMSARGNPVEETAPNNAPGSRGG
jgi:hypothetical protein